MALRSLELSVMEMVGINSERLLENHYFSHEDPY